MALCPFAEKRLVGYDGGAYTGGPFRIVLHTTEGSLASALAEFKVHFASHFLVDGQHVIQLVDTARAGRAMRVPSSGPETNRLSAVQIEMVGKAGWPKDPLMLANVRRLCRWIEAEYGIPRVWPNGYCTPAAHFEDSGHHNRDAHSWATKGGYYGHEHVPGNIHWDPALTAAETDFLMADEPVPGVSDVKSTVPAGMRKVMRDNSKSLEELLITRVGRKSVVKPKRSKRSNRRKKRS